MSGVNANVTFASMSTFNSLASLHMFTISNSPGSVSVKSMRIFTPVASGMLLALV